MPLRQDKGRGMRSGGWEGGSISWVQMPPCLEHLGQLDFPLLLGIIACFRLLGSPSRTEPQLSLCRLKMGFCHHPSVGSQGTLGRSLAFILSLLVLPEAFRPGSDPDLWGSSYPREASRTLKGVLWGGG